MQTLNFIDKTIFFFINQTCSTKALDYLMPIITNQKNWTLPVLCLVIVLMFTAGRRGQITLGVLIICLCMTDFLSAQLIKPWIGRIRPSHEMADQINLLVNKGGKWSFPSNHAANTMALTVVISYFFSKYKTILILLTCLIGISRIYVGVHYPFDVIGGFIIGYIFSWGTLSFWVMIRMRELKKGKNWVWYD